jgi:hypothetical protein
MLRSTHSHEYIGQGPQETVEPQGEADVQITIYDVDFWLYVKYTMVLIHTSPEQKDLRSSVNDLKIAFLWLCIADIVRALIP